MVNLANLATVALVLYIAKQLSFVNGFSGIKFCDEKYFDNMFQDNQYIYLNVYDESAKETRVYRWVPYSNEIDQFVTKVNASKHYNMTNSCQCRI